MRSDRSRVGDCPTTGKAPHRIGLGLDIKSAQSVSGTSLVFDKDSAAMWASQEEKQAHQEWIESEAELEKAIAEMNAAKKAVTMAGEGGGTATRGRCEEEADGSLCKA